MPLLALVKLGVFHCLAKSLMQAFNGSMVYWYNSTSYRDDLTWASAWLYKATGDPGYLSDSYAYWTEHTNQEGIYDLRYLVRAHSSHICQSCLRCL